MVRIFDLNDFGAACKRRRRPRIHGEKRKFQYFPLFDGLIDPSFGVTREGPSSS